MKRFLHVGGVSVFAWVGLLAIAGAAVASVALDSSEVVLSMSPEGVLAGKTLDSGEPFEMTLHVLGAPDTEYGLAVTYEGDAGTCQADAATLHTNPEGKAVWTCELDTADNDGTEPVDGTVTFTVSLEGSEVGVLVANLSVRPVETAEEETPLETQPVSEPVSEASTDNHGHCVSYWAHEAKEAGLEGKHRGAFVSSIAGDPEAVAPKGNDPVSESCDFTQELADALAAQDAEEGADAQAARDASDAKRPEPADK